MSCWLDTGKSSLTADGRIAQSFNNTSDGAFLGIYGQKRWKDVSVDFALNGGSQSFQQQRYVYDNLAYLGNSSANSSYQGLWLSPEVGVTVKAGELSGWSFFPTARLRYAQQWLSAYGESGGAQLMPMSMDAALGLVKASLVSARVKR